MHNFEEYVSIETVQAREVTEAGSVVTFDGLRSVFAGDYEVAIPGRGTTVMSGGEFRERYRKAETQEDSGDAFVPAGKLVDDVVEYMKSHPEEVERIKELESVGGKRKTILEFSL